MNFNPNSLDLLPIWDAYKDFEAFSRETGGDLNHFIEEWKEKMVIVQSAGFQYSDLLLGFKLMEKVNLSQDSIATVISKLCPRNSESFLAQVVTNIREQSKLSGLLEDKSKDWVNNKIGDENHEDIYEDKEVKHSLVSYPVIFSEGESLSTNKLELDSDIDNDKDSSSRKGTRSDSGFLKCPTCEKNFMLKETLEMHIRNHSCSMLGPGKDSSVDQEWIGSTESDSENEKDENMMNDEIKEEVKSENGQESDIKNGHAVNTLAFQRKTQVGKVFKCSTCKKEYKKSSLLKIHMDTHKTTRDHVCPHCNKTYKTKQGLYDHLSRKHRKEKSGTMQQIDSQNIFPASRLNSFHFDDKSLKDENIIDIDVKKEIESEASQAFDQNNDHLNTSKAAKGFDRKRIGKEDVHGKTPSAPRKKFPCEVCNKHVTMNNMKIHMKMHSKESSGKYPCEICGRIIEGRCMKNHMKSHSGSRKSVECNICQKQLKDACQLRYHMETHNTTKDYICSYCGKNYKTKSTLTEHLNVHTKAKPLPCKFCDKIFFLHASRKFHIRVHHTGEKPYKCDFCDKRFYISTRKVEHMRYHTGEKPFPCHVCGKYFRDYSTRKRHVRNVHKEGKPGDIKESFQ